MGGKGSGGHNRKPENIKKMEGTWRRDRATEKKKERSTKPKGYSVVRAPSGLSREAQGLWREVVQGWDLDFPALMLLRQVCESLDELRAAQSILERTGESTIDKAGQEIPHPCVALRKEARNSLLKFWRELGLDVGPPI